MLVERWLRFVVDYRWIVLVATLASIVAAGLLAGGLRQQRGSIVIGLPSLAILGWPWS